MAFTISTAVRRLGCTLAAKMNAWQMVPNDDSDADTWAIVHSKLPGAMNYFPTCDECEATIERFKMGDKCKPAPWGNDSD